MDTVITITVVAKEGVAQETLDRGFEELRRVDTSPIATLVIASFPN